MKKLFSILATLMLMAVSIEASAKADSPQWKECGDAATFAALVKVNADIRLTADIDLSTLTPEDDDYLFNQTFWGRIDGANGNVNVLGGRNFALRNRLKSAGKDIIIFKSLNDVEITNLNIYQCDFDGLDQESGLLSETCYNSTLDNMIFGDCHAVGDVTGYDCDRMGFAAGYAENSHFRNFFFTDCTMITDGSKLGLVAGDAKDCEFTLCSSNMGCELWADGNITSYNSAYVGGFCGYADNCTFSSCYNYAAVSSDDDRVGGIVGYGAKCSIVDCRNVGPIMHCKKEGFGRRNLQIAANCILTAGAAFGTLAIVSSYLSPYSSSIIFETEEQIDEACEEGLISPVDAFNAMYDSDYHTWIVYVAAKGFSALMQAAGPVVFIPAAIAFLSVGFAMEIYLLNDPDEMGGIAGTLDNGSSVLRCWNGGTIECGDEDCGGIVGEISNGSIESCYNRTFVRCHGYYCGGIVGTLNSSTLKHCLNVGVVEADGGNRDYITYILNSDSTDVAFNHYLYDAVLKNDPRAFSQEDLPSGKIALTLNNELIAAGKQPIWRQNLGEDFFPVFDDESRPIVTDTIANYSLWQTVRTAEEFYLAVSNPLAKVSVEADLDLNDNIFNLATRNHPFRGEIKGNGHVLRNCHYATTDEYKDGDCALFPYAKNAKFENLILDGITITPLNSIAGCLENMAIFVAHSDTCEYKNITLRNCSILVNSDEDRLRIVGGLVCNSNYDKVTDCTIDGSCVFQSHVYVTSFSDSYIAGFAAKADHSEFVGCHNAAKIMADDDCVAGIVSYITNGKIQNCLNSGQIIGQGALGGIAGYATDTQILKCVNVGGIDNDDEDHDIYRGGIVGYIKGSESLIQDCMNFGYINWSSDERQGSGCIDGEHDSDSIYGTGNFWHCQFNGNASTAGNDTYNNEILTGKYACDHGYYQSIDNHNDYCTALPVPIAAASTVYSNILCDGTQTYSNIYHSAAAHTGQADLFGNCTICGKKGIGNVSTDIHITDADGLTELARNVNEGMDLTDHTIYLDNDIDMSGVYFTPIGKGLNTPFRGTFVGQGHRIKNLSVHRADNCVGLFGCVSGMTTIQNLIVDSSCRISGTGYGAAGIVGCMALPSEDSTEEVRLLMFACGNEATVNGDINAAGLLGGVYNTDTKGNAEVYLHDCYNSGTITGHQMSAAFIGYGNKYVQVTNCFNTGSVSGYETEHSLIRCKDYEQLVAMNVFNKSSVAYDKMQTTFKTKDFAAGKVCSRLQSRSLDNLWAQNIETDTYPTFGTAGVHYARTMANDWGTLCLPYDVDYSQSNGNYKLYKLSDASVTGDTGTLTFTEYENGTIPAGTPMAVKKLSGEGIYIEPASTPNFSTDITVQNSTNASLPEGWTMNGTFTNKSIGGTEYNGIYFIAQNQFWRAEVATTVAPYRAWFEGPALTASQAVLRIKVADDDTEDLELISDADGTLYMVNGQCLDLQGRQTVSKKGLQIRNGKVIFMR